MKNSIAALTALSIAIPGLALAQPMNGNFGGHKPSKQTPIIVKKVETKVIVQDTNYNKPVVLIKNDNHFDHKMGNQNKFGYNHGHKAKVTIYPPKYTKFGNKCGIGTVSYVTHKGYRIVEKAYMCRGFRGEWNIVQR